MTDKMEITQVPRPPPFIPRPLSASSSVASRSSFGSRSRSPLSTISSADDNYTWSSQDAWYQAPERPQFLSPDTPIPLSKASIELLVERYRAEETKLLQRVSLPKVGSGPPRQRVRKIPIMILGEGFRKLPDEILHLILAELKKIHLGPTSTSCSTCWMRDLVNLGMCCKKWWKAVRIGLYEDIQLIGCDSIIHLKKKLRAKHGTRLTLLRRTLRAQPLLASYVKSLKVPAMPEAAKSSGDRVEYFDLVASLVMACPNLEKLPGFHQTYNHEYSRLVHALSTRTQLTEIVWLINPSPYQRQHRYQFSQDADYFTPTLAPSPLLPEQSHNFLAYHDNWSNLSTLFLHCNRGGTLDAALFPNLIWSLPNLDNLHVSSFPATSFNDSTLLSFPSLKILRLENLPGITAAGLSAYPSPRRTNKMTSLSLISVPLLSLTTLARMFAHLKSLARFTISQAPALTLPAGSRIFLHPYLASPTLQHLHWEFTNPENDDGTDIMAKAILHGGFPALKTIRAPSDHEGVLHKLCRPRRQIELPSDRLRNIGIPLLPHSQSTSAIPSISSPNRSTFPAMPSPKRSTFPTLSSPTRSTFPAIPSPARSLFSSPSTTKSSFSLGHGYSSSISSTLTLKSPARSALSLNLDTRTRTRTRSNSSHSTSSSTSLSPEREKGASLCHARKLAQARIDASRSAPQFHIIVWDPAGEFVERFAVGGFVGTVGTDSGIEYVLRPDVEGSDEAVVGVDGQGRFGLLGDGREGGDGEGCGGYWNSDVVGQGKRSRERWWHTERGRWRELELERFF